MKKILLIYFFTGHIVFGVLASKVHNLKINKVKWLKESSKSECSSLSKVRLKIRDRNEIHFSFKGLSYGVPLIESKKSFNVYRYDSDNESESTSLYFKINNGDNLSGNGTIHIKKENVKILNNNQPNKWVSHNYNCKLNFNLNGDA